MLCDVAVGKKGSVREMTCLKRQAPLWVRHAEGILLSQSYLLEDGATTTLFAEELKKLLSPRVL